MQPIHPDRSTVSRTAKRDSGRRAFLVAGASGAILLGFGGWQWGSRFAASKARWIEAAVRKNLPGVALDEPSLARFIATVESSSMIDSRSQALAVFVARGAPWITQRIPRVQRALETRERQVLTKYLLGSNFFQVGDPRRELIVWSGTPVACGSPWASVA
ncbi:MAG: hypothetical protein ABW110_13570 [Steroidobacteraceae bacterium]